MAYALTYLMVLVPAAWLDAPWSALTAARLRPLGARRLKEVAMYVCVCKAVTDGEIRGAVKLGVRSLADLSSTLGVAMCLAEPWYRMRALRCWPSRWRADCARAGCGDD